MKYEAIIFFFLLFSLSSTGQDFKSSWLLDNNPSNPTEGRRSFDLTSETFIFGSGKLYYSARLAFQYGFGNDRKHFASIQVPFIISDYSGVGTKMGFGDIYLGYYYFPYRDTTGDKSFQAAGFGLTACAPTGNKEQGLSRGDWVMVLNGVFTLRINERWAVYPVAKYFFSFDSTNSLSIAAPPGNLPEPSDVDGPEKVSSFLLEAQVVYEMPKVAAWIMASPQFLYDFRRNDYSLAMQTRFGKMFNQRFGMSFAWAAHISGQGSYNHAIQLYLVSYLK